MTYMYIHACRSKEKNTHTLLLVVLLFQSLSIGKENHRHSLWINQCSVNLYRFETPVLPNNMNIYILMSKEKEGRKEGRK
jgi:hypothetical protein